MTQPTEMSTPETLQRQRRRRLLWSILLAIFIFIAGAATGSGLTFVGMIHRFQHAVRHPETIPPRMAAEMKRRLQLTDDQTRQAEVILSRQQMQLQKIRQQLQPEIVMQLDETHDEIAKILSDEQKGKWDAWFDQLKNRWLPGTGVSHHEDKHGERH